ncbi:uncharacterized protein LOC100679241 isoform X3 [Nasonia vitripennis]|uniref:C2HC/C3H-type domain-containing protein n=1 Tax=Nasonia vitripennis TaxID=7425 RepID=A0A7M7PYF7_NASVI|nr:uncharacterized protein LOC100679241 isoform X3 [Nasonia vitripennis]
MAMLCCVSRKAAGGSDNADAARCRASAELSRFVEVCRDLGSRSQRNEEDEALRRLDEAVLDVAAVASSFSSFRRLETLDEETPDFAYAQQPDVLLPCAVCARKFNPRSLEKHVKICERTAARKRKPFDSAKQRIQGTELAEFLPKQQPLQPAGPANPAPPEPRRSSGGQAHAEERLASRRPNNQWKQSRDEFLRAIRAARGDNPQRTSHQPASNSQQRPSSLSLVSSAGAPTRSNEKGQCPTCQRQFGVKSYDRHVAFCKERSTRLPASPQTSNNVAKERLEARMKYRAPALKKRRPTNREKYSPGGAQKLVVQSPLLARSAIKDAQVNGQKNADTSSPKLPMLKRPGQTHSKESPVGPMKSRPIDRSNRQSDSQESLPNTPVTKQLFSSRRLILLSEVLPSKILPPKTPLSSASSQKSSARLVSQLPSKELSESPKPKTERKFRRSSRMKPRKIVPDQEDEEAELESTGNPAEQSHDYVRWKQIREDARRCESISKVEMLSDLAGLSSLEEGNSTTDEFEYNERMVRSSRSSSARIEEEPSNDRTCAIKAAELEPPRNDDSEEDDLSSASTKTFRKSEAEFVDWLDLCQRNGSEESNENKAEEAPALSKEVRQRLPAQQPNKSHSMPNIADIRAGKRNAEAPERIDRRQRETETQTSPNCSSRRCATYVIDEASLGNSSHRQRLEKTAEASLESRRKLQPPPPPPPPAPAAKNELEKTPRVPETRHQNKAEQRQSFVVFDYYRNAAASDASSVVEPEETLSFDEDFADENESNASELIKEIDSGSFDEADPMASRTKSRPWTGASFAEEHFEKEICTITRLDGGAARQALLLPSIEWKGRFEYHREKIVRAKPQSRIVELDSPRRCSHSERRSLLRRSFERLPRCDWNSYVRRHPDFSMILRGRIGAGKDYNPFLLAEQQLNDLFSDTSEQSSTDGSGICPAEKPNSSPGFPLSQSSSAFVKYPNNPVPLSPSPKQQQQQQPQQQQRISLIAPPTGFDDPTSSDLSSDCTETNSLSRELLTSSSNSNSLRLEREHVLGRRVIVDPSQALGGGEFAPPAVEPAQKIAGNGPNSSSTRLVRPLANRSNSMRASSAPKPPERKISSSSSSGGSDLARDNKAKQNGQNYRNQLNASNLSLSSVISSTDLEMKRSNSLFEELLSSFEDDANSTSRLPSLVSLVRTDPSVLSSTPQGNGHRQRLNGRINCSVNCSDDDAELSSPESIKRPECGGKLSADSAYSSANDVSGKLKLSKFCHECGAKFPDSAKFCCECGVKRLTL